MKFGIADYGLNVWDGAFFDLEERLLRVKEIGYEGLERLEALTATQVIEKAAIFRRLGMDFGTCRGPTPEVSIQWTAALGKEYVWTSVSARDFDGFCRQVNIQAAACARAGIRVGLHNHLGSLVETQAQLEAFMERCPSCGLILDTAHLAAAGGDAPAMARKFAGRMVALHLKDWLVTNPELPRENEAKRGRFCELGAGNIGLDNRVVLRVLKDFGYNGWIFVEQDTHLREPMEDLAVSRQYLREAGF